MSKVFFIENVWRLLVISSLLLFVVSCGCENDALSEKSEVKGGQASSSLAGQSETQNADTACMQLPEHLVTKDTWLVSTIDATALEVQLQSRLDKVDESTLSQAEKKSLAELRGKVVSLKSSGLMGFLLGVNSLPPAPNQIPAAKAKSAQSSNIETVQEPLSAEGQAEELVEIGKADNTHFLMVRSTKDAEPEALIAAIHSLASVTDHLEIFVQPQSMGSLQALEAAQTFSQDGKNKLADKDALSLASWSPGWWSVELPGFAKVEKQSEDYSMSLQTALSNASEGSVCLGFVKTPQMDAMFKSLSTQGMGAMFLADLTDSIKNLQYGSISLNPTVQNTSVSVALAFQDDMQAAVFSQLMSAKVMMLRNFLGGAQRLQQLTGVESASSDNMRVDHMGKLFDHLVFKPNQSKSELYLDESFFVTLGELAQLEMGKQAMPVMP